MTTGDKIKHGKLQYDINREASKILVLLSSKIDKYEYLTGQEIIPSDQRRMIKQDKFIYSPLETFLGKQTKNIEDQGKKANRSK